MALPSHTTVHTMRVKPRPIDGEAMGGVPTKSPPVKLDVRVKVNRVGREIMDSPNGGPEELNALMPASLERARRRPMEGYLADGESAAVGDAMDAKEGSKRLL